VTSAAVMIGIVGRSGMTRLMKREILGETVRVQNSYKLHP
jgi:hypothetical protein